MVDDNKNLNNQDQNTEEENQKPDDGRKLLEELEKKGKELSQKRGLEEIRIKVRKKIKIKKQSSEQSPTSSESGQTSPSAGKEPAEAGSSSEESPQDKGGEPTTTPSQGSEAPAPESQAEDEEGQEQTPEEKRRKKDEAALGQLMPSFAGAGKDDKETKPGEKGAEKGGKKKTNPKQIARQLEATRQDKKKTMKGKAALGLIGKLQKKGMGDGVFIIALFIAGLVDLFTMKPMSTTLNTPSFSGSLFFILYLIFYFIVRAFSQNKFTAVMTRILPFQGLEALPIINMLPFWTLSVLIAWVHARNKRQENKAMSAEEQAVLEIT